MLSQVRVSLSRCTSESAPTTENTHTPTRRAFPRKCTTDYGQRLASAHLSACPDRNYTNERVQRVGLSNRIWKIVGIPQALAGTAMETVCGLAGYSRNHVGTKLESVGSSQERDGTSVDHGLGVTVEFLSTSQEPHEQKHCGPGGTSSGYIRISAISLWNILTLP